MKHVLFLVHGMGIHEPDIWAKEVIQKLEEVSKRYKYFQENSLNEKVEFVPINYDDVINKIIEKWKESGDIVEFAKTQGLINKQVIEFLESLTGEDLDFFWTYLSDVIVYRFFPVFDKDLERSISKIKITELKNNIDKFFYGRGRFYRNLVRIWVINQIMDKISKDWNEIEIRGYHILAHSLGTAVVHDSLHILGITKWENTGNAHFPKYFEFDSLFMIANTSKLLESDIDPYKSIVKPIGTKNTKQHSVILKRYLNFWHELDPVPNIKKFNPNWRRHNRYESIKLNHYREYNIHSFTHYLDNPKVHIPILRSITDYGTISKTEEQSAISNYPQFGGDLEFIKRIKKFINEVNHLKKRKTNKNWLKIIPEFFKIVDKFQK